MIGVAPQQRPALIHWFPGGSPGLGALAEHVLTTGTGRWWADRPDRPRVLAVTCAGHVLMRGDPGALAPDVLADLHSEGAWMHASWGGPAGLAASGHAWAAFAEGRIRSVACTYFLGSAYEDIAVARRAGAARATTDPAGSSHGRPASG
ncbi:hypothetical protein ACFCYC_28165 [Streptomyces sp. NPDC056402]|uniref:hypothetical protein n=1 Tax=Streptomyces sp. NPDC056402 TaxID=3345810 RepID=UPI0035DF6207